jgi:hypothetical protein
MLSSSGVTPVWRYAVRKDDGSETRKHCNFIDILAILGFFFPSGGNFQHTKKKTILKEERREGKKIGQFSGNFDGLSQDWTACT